MYLYHKMHNWTIEHRKRIRDLLMEDVDISVTTYYNYVSGKEKPSVEFLEALMRRLNETGGDTIVFDDLRNDRTKLWFDQFDRIRKVDAHEIQKGGSNE